MAKSSKTLTVPELIDAVNHPLKPVILALREAILNVHNAVGEEVKWNSPCFIYSGDMEPFDPKTYARDIVVLHLRKPDQILLVFPTGARIADTHGVLEGSYTDGRRMVTITSLQELEHKKSGLEAAILDWIKGVK